LSVDEQEGESAAGIVGVHDPLFLSVELIELGAVVGLDLLRREVEIVARVGRGPQVIRGYQVEAEGAFVVRLFAPASQSAEPFEAADQRPPLRGAVRSALHPEEEDADLLARPGGVRDHVELPLGWQGCYVGGPLPAYGDGDGG